MAAYQTPYNIVEELHSYVSACKRDDVEPEIDFLCDKVASLFEILSPPRKIEIPTPADLIRLKDRRDWHKDMEAEYKNAYDQFREELGEEWLEEGRESEKVNGRTVYRTHNIRAYITRENMDAAVEILRQHPDTHGLPQNTVNANSLTAWVKELPRDDRDKPILPHNLESFISISDKWELVVR